MLDQDTVNLCHARHRQEAMRDVDGQTFVACSCGQTFDTEDAALAHWWRALRALQRIAGRRTAS